MSRGSWSWCTDPDGNFYFSSREDDVLSCWVPNWPSELSRHCRHPAVSECLLSQFRMRLGRGTRSCCSPCTGLASIRKTDGVNPGQGEEGLRRPCLPAKVHYVESLPKTASGRFNGLFMVTSRLNRSRIGRAPDIAKHKQLDARLLAQRMPFTIQSALTFATGMLRVQSWCIRMHGRVQARSEARWS